MFPQIRIYIHHYNMPLFSSLTYSFISLLMKYTFVSCVASDASLTHLLFVRVEQSFNLLELLITL